VRALVTRLWRDHRPITIAVTLSLIPRILAAPAFRPARFAPDSFSCPAEGVHPGLSQWHPAGYPLLSGAHDHRKVAAGACDAKSETPRLADQIPA
jgi:hypothetical protein